MEKQCLVTQNLIETIKWYLTAPDVIIKPEKGGDGKTTWKEKALQDTKNLLGREKGEFGEAARRGVEFEKKVYQCVKEGRVAGSEAFQTVCNHVKGYEFGKKGGKSVPFGEETIYFYAKYDAILPDQSAIKDLKTTAEYKIGKYSNGIQHKIYCYISGAKKFEYVVAEWDEYPKIKAIHTEGYVAPDIEILERDVLHSTKECFEVIKDLGLWEIYRTKYCLY